MKTQVLQALGLIALASTSVFAAAGDQLTISNGYTGDVTSYDGLRPSAAGGVGRYYATGITYDAGANLYRPIITFFNPDGTKDTSYYGTGTLVLTDLSQDAFVTSD